MAKIRTAQQIIDQAIAENRVGEILTYIFASIFVVLGAAAMISGILRQNGVVSLAGAVAGALFVPALNTTRRTRRENITMRLLEAPLSRAETAEEAAAMLQKVFSDVFVSEGQQPVTALAPSD